MDLLDVTQRCIDDCRNVIGRQVAKMTDAGVVPELSHGEALLLPPYETNEVDPCHIGCHNHDSPKHGVLLLYRSMNPAATTSLTDVHMEEQLVCQGLLCGREERTHCFYFRK